MDPRSPIRQRVRAAYEGARQHYTVTHLVVVDVFVGRDYEHDDVAKYQQSDATTVDSRVEGLHPGRMHDSLRYTTI